MATRSFLSQSSRGWYQTRGAKREGVVSTPCAVEEGEMACVVEGKGMKVGTYLGARKERIAYPDWIAKIKSAMQSNPQSNPIL